MTAFWDAGNSRAVLVGDGFGWQRMRRATPTPPTGTNQAIYVLRVETPNTVTETVASSVAWNCAAYFGFKFDSSFPSRSDEDHSDYDNFFGMAAADPLDVNDRYSMQVASAQDAAVMRPGAVTNDATMYNANSSAIATQVSISEDSLVIAADDFQPNIMTLIWRVYTSPTDDSVLYQLWQSITGPDLSTFDIKNDMDPDDPMALFPQEGSLKSGTLHGDVNGTNWRPEAGVMAFPTYFMAAHPSKVFELRVPYVGVQYSILTP